MVLRQLAREHQFQGRAPASPRQIAGRDLGTSALSKADIEAWKAFITRREERYRPPYGKHDVVEKRQCLFIGSTNQDDYIKDPTGGRRFWPVKCITIDVEGLAAVRDQLLAEAVVRYRRGERWWPTAEDEVRFFKPQQEKRLEEDPWLPAIVAWLETRAKDVREALLRDLGDGRFTVSQVARGCLGFDGESRIGPRERQRIAKISQCHTLPASATNKDGALLPAASRGRERVTW